MLAIEIDGESHIHKIEEDQIRHGWRFKTD